MEEIKPNEGLPQQPETNEPKTTDYQSLYHQTLKAFENYKNESTAKFDFLNSKVAQLETRYNEQLANQPIKKDIKI